MKIPWNFCLFGDPEFKALIQFTDLWPELIWFLIDKDEDEDEDECPDPYTGPGICDSNASRRHQSSSGSNLDLTDPIGFEMDSLVTNDAITV